MLCLYTGMFVLCSVLICLGVRIREWGVEPPSQYLVEDFVVGLFQERLQYRIIPHLGKAQELHVLI